MGRQNSATTGAVINTRQLLWQRRMHLRGVSDVTVTHSIVVRVLHSCMCYFRVVENFRKSYPLLHSLQHVPKQIGREDYTMRVGLVRV